MKQAYKKRSHFAAANSPPVLADMGEFYFINLFNLSSDAEVRAVMDALLHCKTGFSVKVKNLRNVAVFFDGLLINNLICYNWQSVIEKGRFLISPKTSKSVAASDLSSALYKARTSSTVAKTNIRNDIKQMKKGHTTDM